MAAGVAAPDLPYSTQPAVKNGVEASPAKSAGRVLFGLVLALAMACGVAGALVGRMR